jgi:glutamyl-Q tRNA(Asp) synthetase
MYIGRFAPSPTGPLHLGSLVTALASYLDARSHGGAWHVRIEDIDEPRTVTGAADSILHTLQALGFAWDGPVVYQTQRHPAYVSALEQLQARDLIYPCGCTRKEIADSQTPLQADGAPRYPGTCRPGLAPGKTARAWRIRVPEQTITFTDRLCGPQTENLAAQTGDFVLKRADGLWAYQLAVVEDDAALGVTHVVRGQDLLFSTARQIYLQQQLGYLTPSYCHVPLVLAADGEKLSKQNGAAALDIYNPLACLNQAWAHFHLAPIPATSLAAWWTQAQASWAAYQRTWLSSKE